jgi:hypothetical protein
VHDANLCSTGVAMKLAATLLLLLLLLLTLPHMQA